MLKKYLFAALIILLIGMKQLSAQAPAIQWQKSYGGSADEQVYIGTKTIQTPDGGYIMAGWTRSNDGDVTGVHTSMDFWIVKTEANGNLQWQKSFGGSNNDFATSIDLTSDGGYIVLGATHSNDGDVIGNHGNGSSDMWVLKLDANGNLLWAKAFGGEHNEGPTSIKKTPDGGFIFTGTCASATGQVTQHFGGSDIWVVKTDGNGNIQWQKTFGSTTNDNGNSIGLTNDGGYAIAGSTSSGNGDFGPADGIAHDYWLIKIDASGNMQWQKTYGGSSQDMAFEVKQTPDGGYALAGHTLSSDGDVTFRYGHLDYWFVKTDATGNLQWQKNYGGNGEDYAYAMASTSDGGYIITGYSLLSTFGDITGHHGAGGSDAWVVKINNTGAIQWQKALGGSLGESAYGIQQTTDGGFIVAGNAQSNDGDVTGNHGGYDLWLVKLAPNCNLSVSAGSDEELYFGFGPEQCKSKTAVVTGGTGPYTYNWTLDRPLLSNVITPAGDEVMTGMATNTVTLCLLDTAVLCLTITDAAGCIATDCATIYAEDVRCFAGNSGVQKVRVCHNNNSICIDSSAVQSHVNHGDELGPCGASLTNSNEILQEQNVNPKMIAYTNSGKISVQLNLNEDDHKNAFVQVFGMNGQVIQKIKTSGRNNINVNTSAKGIFIIQLVTEKETIQKRVLIN